MGNSEKYKIKITGRCPDIEIENIYDNKTCYLGVSMNNPFFRSEHLGLLLAWIQKRFEKCYIVIGDYIHRHNIEIFKGIEGQQAVDLALVEGNKMLEILNKQIPNFPKASFQIDRWNVYFGKQEFISQRKSLSYSFETDSNFRTEIENSCKEFIQRQIDRGNKPVVSFNKAIQLSSEYILEEMAVFSLLISMGHKVQVYPGTQLSILKNFANMKFPEINSNLHEGIFVDLTWKKK